MKRRILSVVLALALCLGMLPATVWAAANISEQLTDGITRTTPLNVAAMKTSGNNEVEGWSWDNNSKTLTLSNCHIKAEATQLLYVTDTIKIVLEGENTLETTGTEYTCIIGLAATTWCDITIGGEGSLNILQSSEQNASSNPYGIRANKLTIESGTIKTNVPFCSVNEDFMFQNGSLTIDSRNIKNMDAIYAHGGGITISGGELNIKSGVSGLYVPGDKDLPNKEGAIRITGGTVNIEGPYGLDAQVVDISGDAKVNAVSDTYFAIRAMTGPLTIGGSAQVTAVSTGSYGLCTKNAGDIVISGSAKVTAAGGSGKAGISGTFSTGTDGHAWIDASSISDTANESSWSGIIFNGVNGKVCGNQTLASDAAIPNGKTLTIPGGVTLTVDNGAVLTNNGTLTIEKGGTLDGGGTIPGGGTFKTGNLTADMITVPTGWVYNGNDRSEDIKRAVAVDITICGMKFELQEWNEPEVAKDNDLSYTVIYTYTGDNTTVTKDVTLGQSGTALTATLTGGKTDYIYSEDITVTASVSPTGQAPAKASARLRGLTPPASGEMALYLGDTQVSTAVDMGADGKYTMMVPVKDLIAAGASCGSVRLTAKFVGNDYMADGEGTVTVTIQPASIAGTEVKLDKNVFRQSDEDCLPEVTGVTLGINILTENTDYTVSIPFAEEPGTYTVTVMGKGNYNGLATRAQVAQMFKNISDNKQSTDNGAEVPPRCFLSA